MSLCKNKLDFPHSTILITGVAGFIGMHVCQRLLLNGKRIIGVDNLNSYYDVSLKEDRLKNLTQCEHFIFKYVDIVNLNSLKKIVKKYNVKTIIHLAAQAGVRSSMTNPHDYGRSNLTGFLNILEVCREFKIEHLIYASSSSVYGMNHKIPFSESDSVDTPISLYAATKRANELMAHTYSHLYKLHTTGLRFFTVYGPWGRPDMSPILFARAIFEMKPIDVFNYGQMKRDFTYIDDIVDGIIGVLNKKPSSYFNIFNIGNNKPINLCDYIDTMECIIGHKVIKNFKEIQPGDVPVTFANIDAIKKWVNFEPRTTIEIGLTHLIKWVKTYYKYS